MKWKDMDDLEQAESLAQVNENLRKTIDELRTDSEVVLTMQTIDALKMAYRKHVLMDDRVGWDELSKTLCDALCEAIGDQGFEIWRESIKP